MIKNAAIRIGIKIKPSDKATSVISANPQNNEVIIKLPGDDIKRIQADMIHDASETN
jgi:hypothetical protein